MAVLSNLTLCGTAVGVARPASCSNQCQHGNTAGQGGGRTPTIPRTCCFAARMLSIPMVEHQGCAWRQAAGWRQVGLAVEVQAPAVLKREGLHSWQSELGETVDCGASW